MIKKLCNLLKTFKHLSWWVIGMGVIVVVAAVISQWIFGPDNTLEEAGEKYLKEKTSIDIDFSPTSPETMTGGPGFYKSRSPLA